MKFDTLDKKPQLYSLLIQGALVFLAVFAKETAIVLPLLLLVVSIERARTAHRTFPRKDWFVPRMVPALLSAILVGTFAYIQIHQGMAASGMAPSLDPNRSGHFAAGAPWTLAISASIRSFSRHLLTLAWPFGHSIDPPFSLSTPLLSWPTLISAVIGISFVVVLVLLMRHRSEGAAPMFWMAAALSPYLLPSLLRAGHTAVLADRYAYLASLGFAWALSLSLCRLCRTLPLKVLHPVPILVVLCFYATGSHAQIRDYRSSESFWGRAARFNPASAPSHLNHAMALWKETGDPEAARREFERMVESAPDFHFGLCAYADFLLAHDGGEKALAHIEKALRDARQPALLLRKRAALLLVLSRFREALDAFRAAETAGVDAPSFQRGFAEACKRNLLWPEAVRRYRLAATDPQFRPAYKRHRLLVENPPLAAYAPLDVVVLGDSVPHGTGAVCRDGLEHPLSERLARMRPGLRAKDCSVPGITAADLNRDFTTLLPSTNAPACFCLLMVGHNDAFFGLRQERILFELSGCVFKARLCGMRPIVIGPIRVESTETRNRVQQEAILDSLDGLLAEFCQSVRCDFLSPRRTFLSESPPDGGWITPVDGNHLSDAGMESLSSLCLKTLPPCPVTIQRDLP